METNLPSRHRAGFTLIEIMLVVAILSLLATLAIPNYLRARKRSQAARIIDDLRAVDHAMELYSIEFRRSGNETLTGADVQFLKRYVKDRVLLYQSLPNDMFGNPFIVTDLKTPPRLNNITFEALSDVAPSEFWSPYEPVP
jgi:prepilin-type N-terminal cleavage/methylation domain-containing protein